MSPIRVLILQQGSPDHVLTWTEGNDSPQLRKWKDCASLWPEALLAERPEPMDVFFCVDKELLAQGFDPTVLHLAIQNAHRSMWAANVYVVVDKLWQPEDRNPEGPEPFDWIRKLLGNRVTDVLEWSVRSESNYTEAASRSRDRMQGLRRDPAHHPWKCFFQTSLGREEERLLSRFLVRSLTELKDENSLVVLRPLGDNYLSQVTETLTRMPDGEIIIGIVDRLVRLPVELESLCRSKGWGLVRFHGISEVYYFLEKLNDSRLDSLRLYHQQLIEANLAIPIRVVGQQFKSNRPQLLITHSYVAGKPDDCWLAAKDTWELIHDLPSDVRVKIYPAIKSGKLADIVKELGHILAWIHIGHGDPKRGVQQSDDHVFKSPQDWLTSFVDYNSSLALAMFATCYSEAVAREFAAAGVGVTIGFAEEVHKQVCIEVTKRVVAAAIESNGERAAVLAAFSKGQKRLVSENPEAGPLAFCATH